MQPGRPRRHPHRELGRGHARLVGRRRARAPSPCRSTPPTRASTCATSSPTPGRGCSSSRPTSSTGPRRSPTSVEALDHVVVIGDHDPADARRHRPTAGPTCSRPTTTAPTVDVRPSRPRHVHLHRRHHRPVQGLHAQPQLPRGAGPPDRHLLAAHRRRRGVDAAAAVPLQRHHHRGARPARVRRPRRDLPALLGVELLARDEPRRRHRSPRRSARWPTCSPTTSTGPRCRSRAAPRPTRRCASSARRRCRSRSTTSSASRFGVETFSRCLRRHRGEPHLVAAARACATGPTPPAW